MKYAFFISIFPFGKQARVCLVKIRNQAQDYASDMLIFVKRIF